MNLTIVVNPKGKRFDTAKPYDALIPPEKFKVGERVELPVIFGTEDGYAHGACATEKKPCRIVQINPLRRWFRVEFEMGRGRTTLSECYKFVVQEVGK